MFYSSKKDPNSLYVLRNLKNRHKTVKLFNDFLSFLLLILLFSHYIFKCTKKFEKQIKNGEIFQVLIKIYLFIYSAIKTVSISEREFLKKLKPESLLHRNNANLTQGIYIK